MKMVTPIEVIEEMEVLLTEHTGDAELFQGSSEFLFINRMIAFKNALKCALEAEKMLFKSSAQLEIKAAPAPAPSVTTAASAAAGGSALFRAPAPQFQLTDQQNMDIKYSALRSSTFPPLSFAPGIDPYNAIVGVLVQVGQGNKFANSVAFRTCFQVWFFY